MPYNKSLADKFLKKVQGGRDQLLPQTQSFDAPYFNEDMSFAGNQPQAPRTKFDMGIIPRPPQFNRYNEEMDAPEPNLTKANKMKQLTRDQAIGQLASSLFKGLTFSMGGQVAAERPTAGYMALDQLQNIDRNQDQVLREGYQRM